MLIIMLSRVLHDYLQTAALFTWCPVLYILYTLYMIIIYDYLTQWTAMP